MLQNVTRLVSQVGEKVAHLYLENDTPIESVKTMLFDFLKIVGQIEDNIKAQQAAQAAESVPEAPKEPVAESAPVEAENVA